MNRPVYAGETAHVLLLTLAAFASVTNSLQMSPLLTALADEFNKSESAIGKVSSISSLMGMAAALAIAPWMPRWPMRTWLQAQCLVLLASVAVMSTAQSFEALIVARVIAGIGGGAFLATCFTAAGEIVSDPSRTGRSVATVASGTTIAILAGVPLVAQIRELADWRWAAAAVAVPLVVVLVGSRWLPAVRAPGDLPMTGRGAMSSVLRHHATSLILLSVVLLFVAYFGWFVYFSAYVENDFAGGASLISALFLVGGFAELGGNSIAPSLLRRYSGFAFTLAGCVGTAIALLGSGIIFSASNLLFVSVVLLHICVSFSYIGTYTLLLGSMPGQKATMMAVASAATGLGAFIGAFFGGVLLDVLDDYAAMYQVLGLLMLAAAGAVFASKRATQAVR